MLTATETRSEVPSAPESGAARLSCWLRVREFAVPAPMIDSAAERRAGGDWAGACAAARVDVDLDLRRIAGAYGRETALRIRRDLRHFAPDLLRWHFPRISPDGLLRPGLTLSLARYATEIPGRRPHLVVRTPPAWAEAGQRISLTVWDGARPRGSAHPHPRPNARFRLDLHRHLWDARRAGELRERAMGQPQPLMLQGDMEPNWAVHRWADEARRVLAAEGRGPEGRVVVSAGRGRRLAIDTGERRVTQVTRAAAEKHPLLPDAATWVPPDLELLRAGLIDAGQLHPLVATALTDAPVRRRPPQQLGAPQLVDCRGARHRIGFVDGRLAALDHEPEELRREELLTAFGGPPMPCLQAIDVVHRRPEALDGVRERLAHGDTEGALAVVEGLLGPEAVLREGPLREALETAALRRIDHGLYRAGLAGHLPAGNHWCRRCGPGRTHPLHACLRHTRRR
ncbi:hypothetical protein [Streptomyces sp. KLOTTS4A1]|uniref:hypothetical protein n=1 Tax=Streptomyces sp. KLOTTS4A1 TaxID=3390996 RepID=UPI0039F54568